MSNWPLFYGQRRLACWTQSHLGYASVDLFQTSGSTSISRVVVQSGPPHQLTSRRKSVTTLTQGEKNRFPTFSWTCLLSVFQRAPVTMGRHLELSTCSLLISVRAGDLQNGQAFSIIHRRKNLLSRTPFLMERPLHFRREHSTFYLAFFWPYRYDISCVSSATRHLTDYVDQTDCLPKDCLWSELGDASCLDVLQSVFESFRFGTFFHVLLTSSYSRNPTGSVSVIHSPSTLFPVWNAFTSPDIPLELRDTWILFR
jgi:hypothetical protein